MERSLCRLFKKTSFCASFPPLQPVAELRRNQRGETGRQHVKAHSCSHISPCFDHTSPTQTDDGTIQIDHDIGAYVSYSFRTLSRVLLRPLPNEVQGWRKQGQRLNVTANDAIIWTKKGVSQLAWSHQFFLKTLVDGPAAVWAHDFPLSRPALFRLS